MMDKEVLIITDEKIISTHDNYEVMHRWEDPLMKLKAEWVCQDGGDILELGFGMGISATYIQQHNINSHTICEINPQILEKLHIWAKDKPNVIILEGGWYPNVPQMKTYNGILFDTHKDPTHQYFRQVVSNICKPNCKITWWNNTSDEWNELKLEGEVDYEIIDVNPPLNKYFNHKKYYMPKYIYNA